MKKKYLGKTVGSLLIVLLMMPLGHALMILMEHFLEPTTLHYSAFLMGFVGLVVTIAGVFVKGDTRQTCFGLAGALLFWTGWVEFLFAYFAQRFGVHCDLIGNGVVQTVTEYVNGVGVNHTFTINGTPLEDFSRAELKEIRGSRPEYLIMPATFGMWMMFVVMYTFCTRLSVHPLGTETLRHKREGRAAPDGVSSEYSDVYGVEYHDVGTLHAAHVLLRPRIPRRPSPRNLRRCSRLSRRFGADVQEADVYSHLGTQSAYGLRYGHRVLDLRRGYRTQRTLQGDMGRSAASCGGDERRARPLRSAHRGLLDV